MRKKAAMNLAMGPGKQVGMNMFMMYMSEKSLTIWTMNMLSSLLTGPITALSNVTKTFKKSESEGVDLTKEVSGVESSEVERSEANRCRVAIAKR